MNKSEWVTKSEDGVEWQSIFGTHVEITLEVRPRHCIRGNWIAKVFPDPSYTLEINSQDPWPRYYFDEQRAKLECEAWLRKRGLFIS